MTLPRLILAATRGDWFDIAVHATIGLVEA
jgi:hypothetical protein